MAILKKLCNHVQITFNVVNGLKVFENILQITLDALDVAVDFIFL